MTWAEAKKRVTAAGGVFVRQGSTAHEKWRLPNGTLVLLLGKHRQQQIPVGIAADILKAIEADRCKGAQVKCTQEGT